MTLAKSKQNQFFWCKITKVQSPHFCQLNENSRVTRHLQSTPLEVNSRESEFSSTSIFDASETKDLYSTNYANQTQWNFARRFFKIFKWNEKIVENWSKFTIGFFSISFWYEWLFQSMNDELQYNSWLWEQKLMWTKKQAKSFFQKTWLGVESPLKLRKHF